MSPNFKNSTITSSESSCKINSRYFKPSRSEPIPIPYVRPDRRINRIFAYDDGVEDEFEKMIRENPELDGFAIPEENSKEQKILSPDDINKKETISEAEDVNNTEQTIETAFDALFLQMSGGFPGPTESCKILKVAEAAHWGSWIVTIKNKIKSKFVNI